MRATFVLVFSLSCGLCVAGILPVAQREELISLAMQNFWGKVKLSNGEFAQPSSETERETVPVPVSIANRALDVGEVSGMGAWCKLEWQSNYLALTKAARSLGLNDKQVAFVSVLHGAAAGRVSNAASKAPCTEQQRINVQKMLEQSKARGLGEI